MIGFHRAPLQGQCTLCFPLRERDSHQGHMYFEWHFPAGSTMPPAQCIRNLVHKQPEQLLCPTLASDYHLAFKGGYQMHTSQLVELLTRCLAPDEIKPLHGASKSLQSLGETVHTCVGSTCSLPNNRRNQHSCHELTASNISDTSTQMTYCGGGCINVCNSTVHCYGICNYLCTKMQRVFSPSTAHLRRNQRG